MSLPPPTPDDELVSAVLDDAASAAERARVAADPRLQARLRALRTVRDAVATPVEPLDEVTQRRLRDAAMADAPPNATEAAIAWTTAMAPRRRSTVITPAIFGVAALVLLLLVAVPLLGSIELGGDDDDAAQSGDEATALSAESDDAGGGADGAYSYGAEQSENADAEGGGSGDAAPLTEDLNETEELARPMADLGPFRSVDDLLDSVAGRIGLLGGFTVEPEATSGLPLATCAPEPIDGREGSSAYATAAGEPVIVHVRPLEVGQVLLEVVDPVTCDVVAERAVDLTDEGSTSD